MNTNQNYISRECFRVITRVRKVAIFMCNRKHRKCDIQKNLNVNILIKEIFILCENADINTKIVRRNIFAIVKKNCTHLRFIMFKMIRDVTFFFLNKFVNKNLNTI